jgi:hypothetical protein
MALEHQGFETMEGQSFPTVRQVSVFLDNRMGQLLRMTKVLDREDVRILALSVIDSVDCAIVRLLFDSTDTALDVLKQAGFAISVTEVLVVQLPPGKRAMMTILSALLTSEINVAYVYPLLPGRIGQAIALAVDNLDIAVDTLQRQRFRVLGEADLNSHC